MSVDHECGTSDDSAKGRCCVTVAVKVLQPPGIGA